MSGKRNIPCKGIHCTNLIGRDNKSGLCRRCLNIVLKQKHNPTNLPLPTPPLNYQTIVERAKKHWPYLKTYKPYDGFNR